MINHDMTNLYLEPLWRSAKPEHHGLRGWIAKLRQRRAFAKNLKIEFW